MIRVEGQGIGPSDPGVHSQEGTQPQLGTLAGEEVEVKDAASILDDAKEEISMHFGEMVEEKTFEERQLEKDVRIGLLEIQQITDYLDAATRWEDPQKLADLIEQLQSAQKDPGEVVRRNSREPSEQYVLLHYALHDAKQKGLDPETIERIEDAIADLEMEQGPQIRAGLNSIGVAGEYGKTPEEIETFQSVYRDVVLGDNTLSQTLKLALERIGGDGGEDLQRGLQALIKALGTDLSSARPSTDPNRLQALVQDLYLLEVTATVLDGCNELSDKLRENHGSPGVQPGELMKELVAITGERWVGAPRFTALTDRFNLQDVGAQIAFLTGTKLMMRELPVKVFSDPDTRQAVLDATQGALDEAIDREEE